MRKNIILLFVISFSAISCGHTTEVSHKNWDDTVMKGINDFLSRCGGSDNGYAVFDFDNTCSIFDDELATAIHQFQTMSFAFTPEQVSDILSANIGNPDSPRVSMSADGIGHSYRQWLEDISADFETLWDSYGGFSAAGVDTTVQGQLAEDPVWIDFTVKTLTFYDLLIAEEGEEVAYEWLLYLFTGMDPQQVYDLAARALKKYKDVETFTTTLTSVPGSESQVGSVSYQWTGGISVTENIQELFKALNESHIDVWICSASLTDVIRAAVDVFDLHKNCKGVVAMTLATDEEGRYIPEYDYTSGYSWNCTNLGWERGNVASGAITQGAGKTTAIKNILVSRYGCGPLAGFMDSTGDFNFCTEFSSLKFVICFNTGNRSVTNGGGLIAEIAIYQKEYLNYDFDKAIQEGDTYYVLQGRDENGKRSFVASDCTLKAGRREPILFRNEDNKACLDYMVRYRLSVKDAIEKFSLTNQAGELPFQYGFLDSYAGYHCY